MQICISASPFVTAELLAPALEINTVLHIWKIYQITFRNILQSDLEGGEQFIRIWILASPFMTAELIAPALEKILRLRFCSDTFQNIFDLPADCSWLKSIALRNIQHFFSKNRFVEQITHDFFSRLNLWTPLILAERIASAWKHYSQKIACFSQNHRQWWWETRSCFHTKHWALFHDLGI